MSGGISRSQITVAVNNDKTGYSLTAGSYSIRASSVQRGTISIASATSATASLSAVTMARAVEAFAGSWLNEAEGSGGNAFKNSISYLQLTSTTVVTATRGTADANGTTVGFTVAEYF